MFSYIAILSPKHMYTYYVRDQFGNFLLHPRTLSCWYMAIDRQPEFTKESYFYTLTDKVNKESTIV